MKQSDIENLINSKKPIDFFEFTPETLTTYKFDILNFKALNKAQLKALGEVCKVCVKDETLTQDQVAIASYNFREPLTAAFRKLLEAESITT